MLHQAIKFRVVTHKYHLKAFNWAHSPLPKALQALGWEQQLRHRNMQKNKWVPLKKGHFLVWIKPGQATWAADPRMFCFRCWEAQLTFPAALPGWVSTDARSEHRELEQHPSTKEQMPSCQILPLCTHTGRPWSRGKKPFDSRSEYPAKI